MDEDGFFKEFGELDAKVYSDGAIPKKYKELTGLSISILTMCEDCIVYHLDGCKNNGCSKTEVIDAIKLGVIGGGSITYPSARFAISMVNEINFE
jgi:AhpD family alkylhydroperoxidase